ncbi:DNA internalization-related competence protein ComEC/Rec2 [bacterium]|nr:DNA internalization-related competence protein ComEC/Rec2 [bacterium]
MISGKSKKIAGLASIAPLVLYGIFTGFSPSCQRALIMIIVLIFSFIREKEIDIISSLCFAGILILLIDSAALFSISFQLSFAAVVFIIYGVLILKLKLPLLKESTMWAKLTSKEHARFESKHGSKIKLKSGSKHISKVVSKIGLMVCVTLFAGLGTSPLTSHYFNSVSIIAPLSNLIAIPVLGFFVLPLGLVGLIFFSWFPALAEFIIMVCSKLISFLIIFSEALVSWPFTWSRIVTLTWSEIGTIYILFLSVFLILKGYKKACAVALIAGCTLIVFNFVHLNLKDDNLKITIFDVGQGSSTLIQTPDGSTILVDGGGFFDISSFDTGRYIIGPYLWKNRIKTIDYVILTHPESDHMNGLIFILDNFNVKTLIKNSDTRDTISYNLMMQICEKNNIKIFNPLDHGKNLDLNNIQLIFFDSFKDTDVYNLNNNSLVFKINFNKFSMLFPGDILKLREHDLSKKSNIDLNCDVMLAPHHGSSSSSSKIFLEKVHPLSVIISCGWNNKYGFPDHNVLKRYKDIGTKIFRTDENGAVGVSSDGETYKIETFIN